jgi:hypothetical protein
LAAIADNQQSEEAPDDYLCPSGAPSLGRRPDRVLLWPRRLRCGFERFSGAKVEPAVAADDCIYLDRLSTEGAVLGSFHGLACIMGGPALEPDTRPTSKTELQRYEARPPRQLPDRRPTAIAARPEGSRHHRGSGGHQ